MLIENISEYKINMVRKIAVLLEEENDTFTTTEMIDRIFHEYRVVVSLKEARCILREFYGVIETKVVVNL